MKNDGIFSDLMSTCDKQIAEFKEEIGQIEMSIRFVRGNLLELERGSPTWNYELETLIKYEARLAAMGGVLEKAIEKKNVLIAAHEQQKEEEES